MPSPVFSTDRRALVKGAAWSVPAIVVATAAPAVAASGPALVATTIPTTANTGATETALPVVINFVNSNTGSTGDTSVVVRFVVAAGALNQPQGTVTSATPTGLPAGWTFLVTGGSDTNRTFSFRRSAGIAGAPNASSTATTVLSFTVSTTESVLGNSAGTITTVTTPTNGTVANGSGAWT